MNGQTQEFCWGTKKFLFKNETCFVDLLEIKPGGYSSKHSHEQLINEFFILDGRLEVTTFYLDDPETNNLTEKQVNILDSCINKIIIAPAEIHQFKNPFKGYCRVLEIGSVLGACRDDIIRYSERGCDVK